MSGAQCSMVNKSESALYKAQEEEVGRIVKWSWLFQAICQVPPSTPISYIAVFALLSAYVHTYFGYYMFIW